MLTIGKEFELIDHHDGNNFRGEVRCHRGDVRNDNERKVFCVETLLQGVQITDLCKKLLKCQDKRLSCRSDTSLAVSSQVVIRCMNFIPLGGPHAP